MLKKLSIIIIWGYITACKAQTVELIDPHGIIIYKNSEIISLNKENYMKKIGQFRTKDLDKYSRPKFRYSQNWYTNNKILVSEDSSGLKKTIKFPENILSFCEFDVLSGNEILIWGVDIGRKVNNEFTSDLKRKEFGMIFDTVANKFTSIIQEIDKSQIKTFSDMVKLSEVFLLRVDSYVVIVEKFTSNAYIYDIFTKKIKKITLNNENEIPPLNYDINNGPIVFWATPLSRHEILVSCRLFIGANRDQGDKIEWINVFKRVNLSDGTIFDDMTEYKGHRPDGQIIIINEDGNIIKSKDGGLL